MKRPILIIGTLPPPLGGISIHVKRLLETLDARNKEYEFIDLRRTKLLHLLRRIWKTRVIHFNLSNAYIRLILVLYSYFLGKRIIFTLHGRLGSLGRIRYYADLFTIKLADQPLLLNDFSFRKSGSINENSLLIPAFIPPVNEPDLQQEIYRDIEKLKNDFPNLWTTNASHVRYDKNNQEIYQITLLIDIFAELESHALIISDPSGTYNAFFTKRGISIPSNIMMISYPHSFFKVLEECDGFLRITTTDGDSLSVKEALTLNKIVIATNVVDRPKGVILVDLEKEEIKKNIINPPSGIATEPTLNAAEALMEIYDRL